MESYGENMQGMRWEAKTPARSWGAGNWWARWEVPAVSESTPLHWCVTVLWMFFQKTLPTLQEVLVGKFRVEPCPSSAVELTCQHTVEHASSSRSVGKMERNQGTFPVLLWRASMTRNRESPFGSLEVKRANRSSKPKSKYTGNEANKYMIIQMS